MNVSIIIPVYNGAQFIKRAINSVICQSSTSWELIVVDDHSTDATVEIVKQVKLADNRIKLITNNGTGVTFARESGVKIARGKYLFFMDADDTIPPVVIGMMTNAVKKRSDVEIIIGDILDVQASGMSLKHYAFHDIQDGRQLFDWIIDSRMGFLWGKMIKRDLFLSLPVIPYELKFCEDLVQMIQLSYMSHKVQHIGCVSYEYYQNNESVCNNPLIRSELGGRFYNLCKILRDLIKTDIFDSEAIKQLKITFLYYGRLYLWVMGRWGKDSNLLKTSFELYLQDRELINNPFFGLSRYRQTRLTAVFPWMFSVIYIFLLRYKYHRLR